MSEGILPSDLGIGEGFAYFCWQRLREWGWPWTGGVHGYDSGCLCRGQWNELQGRKA